MNIREIADNLGLLILLCIFVVVFWFSNSFLIALVSAAVAGGVFALLYLLLLKWAGLW